MINSMTGFGRAEGQHGNMVFRVEVRSVNNKGLKVQNRLADAVSFFESDIEGVVKRHVDRGTVYVTIECVSAQEQTEYEFNMDALRSYHVALRKIHQELGKTDDVPILELVNLPGVLQKATDLVGDDDNVRKLLSELVEQALNGLAEMRRVEGENLARDLQQRCEGLLELLAGVEARAPQAVNEYRERLTDRIAEMLKPMGVEANNQEFYREVAIFAERSDVAEEIARLKSHVEQLLASLDAADPVGRKIEFIAQEMFREANTMASKSNDTAMVQTVVDIKGEIDRVREQVLNVE